MGHVACMREKTNAGRVLVGKPEGKRQLEDLGIDTILLNLMFKKVKGRHGLNQSGSGLGQGTSCYEKAYTRYGEFLDCCGAITLSRGLHSTESVRPSSFIH